MRSAVSKEFTQAPNTQLRERQEALDDFLRVAFDPDERPLFVSDDASLWSLVAGNEDEVKARCQAHYGVALGDREFGLTIPRLLDYLTARRSS
jgi:hypothetical protein